MGLLDRFLGPRIEKLEANHDVAALLGLTKHEKVPLRLQSLEALIRLDRNEAIPSLIEALRDEDADVRKHAEAGLDTFGSRAMDALVKALGDGESGSTVLDFILKRQQMSILIEALQSGEDPARLRSAEALEEMLPSVDRETQEIGLKAMRAALGDRRPEIRCIAASILGTMKDEHASKALAAELKDGRDEVRKACARSLREIGLTALPHILNALAGRSPRARAEAADLLAEMAPEFEPDTRLQVIEDLNQTLDDRNEKVRNRALAALKKLSPSEY